jgi:hypothetical protein
MFPDYPPKWASSIISPLNGPASLLDLRGPPGISGSLFATLDLIKNARRCFFQIVGRREPKEINVVIPMCTFKKIGRKMSTLNVHPNIRAYSNPSDLSSKRLVKQRNCTGTFGTFPTLFSRVAEAYLDTVAITLFWPTWEAAGDGLRGLMPSVYSPIDGQQLSFCLSRWVSEGRKIWVFLPFDSLTEGGTVTFREPGLNPVNGPWVTEEEKRLWSYPGVVVVLYRNTLKQGTAAEHKSQFAEAENGVRRKQCMNQRPDQILLQKWMDQAADCTRKLKNESTLPYTSVTIGVENGTSGHRQEYIIPGERVHVVDFDL